MSDEIFLSYVRENSATAERLARDLEAAGVRVWLDRTRLAPGDRWRDAIRNAIRNGHLFVACFSREFAARDRSHMNEELMLAIEELRSRPTDRTWFIPVVIDGSEVPDRDIGASASLRDLQWVDLSNNWNAGVASIVMVALRNRPSQNGLLSVQSMSGSAHPSWTKPVQAQSTVSVPDLRLSYALQQGSAVYIPWRGLSYDEIRVLLTLTNHGSSAASAGYIRLQVPLGFTIDPSGVASRESGAPLQAISEGVQPPASAFIARPDFLLHPNVPVQFARVMTTIKRNMPVPSCAISYQAAASSGTVQGTLNISPEEIAHVTQRTIEPRER